MTFIGSGRRRKSARFIPLGSLLLKAAAFVVLPLLLFWYLIALPGRPTEQAVTAKEPEIIAECIARQYPGSALSGRGVGRFRVSVPNGRAEVLMEIAISGTRDGSLVQVRRGRLYRLANAWRRCL